MSLLKPMKIWLLCGHFTVINPLSTLYRGAKDRKRLEELSFRCPECQKLVPVDPDHIS